MALQSQAASVGVNFLSYQRVKGISKTGCTIFIRIIVDINNSILVRLVDEKWVIHNTEIWVVPRNIDVLFVINDTFRSLTERSGWRSRLFSDVFLVFLNQSISKFNTQHKDQRPVPDRYQQQNYLYL